MKTTLSAAALHKQYEEGISAFRRLIQDPALRLRFSQEVDGFMRQTALGVWAVDGGLTPLHVEYHNAIYCRGNAVPSVLYWELASSIGEYSGFQVPEFFRRLVAYDKQTGKKLSRRFVDTFTLLLLSFAAVDNVVSEKEAAFVNLCADTLLAVCDAEHLPSDRAGLNVAEFITSTPSIPPSSPPSTPLAPPSSTPDPAASQPISAEKEAVDPPQTTEELLAELDQLCGLEKVKEDVKGLINLVKVRKMREEAGLPTPPMSLHLVFMGNPGTGKTTVARLLAKIYQSIGVLSKGQLVEVDRSGLVAGFVGQTAIKTGEVLQKALGGVLFIDEAYALSNHDNPNDFGQEAIETLLKGMEDHRDDLIVIVAGYTDLMEGFIHSNPGLESRFNKYFLFEDYAAEELMSIFRSMCAKNGYTLDEETDRFCMEAFEKLYEERDENFGNARDVRNIFEQGIARQANRVAALERPTKEDLMALTVADLAEEEEAREEAAEAEAPDGAAPAAPDTPKEKEDETHE